ncbi:hypothetical protein [Erythrobacter aureus]|uniref:hypothetical protein n=1 Tax=Erythrobacter aureus TaxID=2182384 RepID=UPI0013B3DFCD|nr:hypothetical protein [Erythrobacter aureus]
MTNEIAAPPELEDVGAGQILITLGVLCLIIAVCLAIVLSGAFLLLVSCLTLAGY